MTGDLVYAKAGGSLAYKSGGDSLVWKSDKVPTATGGEIEVVIIAAQDEVGPIQGCGNHHNVVVSIDGSHGSNAGQASVKFAAAAKSLSVTTESNGCAYPENNPPMPVTIMALQQSSGVRLTTSGTVPNVATGSFTVTVSVGARGILAGIASTL